MVIKRGEIWWADVAEPRHSEAGFRRPVLVVQDDRLNGSRLNTVIVLPLSSNLSRGHLATQVILRSGDTGLAKDSVVIANQILLLDRAEFIERVGALNADAMELVELALMTALGLLP